MGRTQRRKVACSVIHGVINGRGKQATNYWEQKPIYVYSMEEGEPALLCGVSGSGSDVRLGDGYVKLL